MRYYALIPVRYASSRFPGKPLAPILGEPMFSHVFRRVRQCDLFSAAYMATDDERIAQEAKKRDIPCVLTRLDHGSGTDRVLEAAENLGLEEDAVIANIQGDEPTLLPSMLTQLLEPFHNGSAQVTTLVKRISAEQAQNPDLVKVVLSRWGRALYFSRSPVPYARNPGRATYWGHIGLYAYRMRILRFFAQTEPSPLERTEKLEQLRLLESEVPIHAVATEHAGHGVDSPQDVPVAEEIIQEQERCGLF
ncbi:MAG: 3-deoxy-manno-octulosonate cytidylyltransferase [Desulfohalobiaceae bacterium]|nr:3-deoxy-manno-octulosonate cytidylyltransferase [Desulfohalobiaceae bacterium]